MCMSKAPSIPPAPPPPPPPQAAKSPEGANMDTVRKSAPSPMASGTLLTGPTGIEQDKLNLGKSSLLGA